METSKEQADPGNRNIMSSIDEYMSIKFGLTSCILCIDFLYAKFTILNPRKSKERKQAKEKDPTSKAKRGPVR